MAVPLALALERRVRGKQRAWRAVGVQATVVRKGESVWSCGVGTVDVERPDAAPTDDTAFAIGSITKTFTAALIMRLRDAGELRLTDRLDDYLPEIAAGGALTVRELLAHASGIQREPPGDIWDTLEIPTIGQTIAELGTDQEVLPPRLRFHYSNLAFGLLGEIGARVTGQPWAAAVQSHLLDPLGMSRTGLTISDPHATGYFVDPFTSGARAEPWPDMGGFAAAGGFWSTAADLATWSTVFAGRRPDVLAPATVDEMTRPEIMVDLEKWTAAYGLGLQLMRAGERIYVGHSGGMPGFISGLAVHRPNDVAAIVLTNGGVSPSALELAMDLVGIVLDQDPNPAEVWRPAGAIPTELAELVGPWWSEGMPFTFSVEDGRLEARLDGLPKDKPPAVFEPIATDVYRTVSGREQGELLRVERNADGAVARMLWATYPFTRTPQPFGPG